MSLRNKRIQNTQDVFLHMGDKAFFDNEYAMAPPSLIKGLENPYDRNGLHDMKLVRELCQRMEGEPITEPMNPSAVDMRYAFGDGDKPKFPTPRLAEMYDTLLRQQQILDFTEHNKHVQESLRQIHTAGDVDLMNRAMESGSINTMDPKVLNNPLIQTIVRALPSQGGAQMDKLAVDTVNKVVKDTVGVDINKIKNDVVEPLTKLI
ncbi:MAG: hypothetical protein IM488_18290 [Microcystis sp. M025S2]|uniref:hypothetical protein n=1 Tax=Microcystis sp. M025S2 TaxID=2771161 RepID=UPI002586F18E|nr:hypothetical protein [Microcystis sp. M025S2]MCA2711278.1 hypothetical protein [Microcystis sp. M025S2]